MPIDDKKDLQNTAVATMNLKEMDTSDLIDLAAAKKAKADFAAVECNIVTAEIQDRVLHYLDDRHIKFTERAGTGRTVVAVTVAQTVDILNYPQFRNLLGTELVDEKVCIKKPEVKYDIDKLFKQALTAIILDDYERNMTIEDVLDKAGWCADDPKKKASLLKKLKGEYKADKKTVLAALNMTEDDIDIDTELYLIYQIHNWQLITAFFEEETFEETAEQIKRYVTVNETVKVGIKI